LLQHPVSAGSPGERRRYLEALGNSGAPRALPALRAAMSGDDRQLASAAAFSLRFVPGPDADALLEQSIGRPEVALAAIRATAYRDPARWRPLLLAARDQYPGHDGIQGEIRAILRRWG
jgi:HEAT repeat protein